MKGLKVCVTFILLQMKEKKLKEGVTVYCSRLVVLLPSLLSIFWRFLLTPGSVCLGGCGARLCSRKLSWQESTLLSSSRSKRGAMSFIPRECSMISLCKCFLWNNISNEIMHIIELLHAAYFSAIKINSNWPLLRLSPLKSSAHWLQLCESLISRVLLLVNRSGLDWDTWEPKWCRARTSKCCRRGLWLALDAFFWGEDFWVAVQETPSGLEGRLEISSLEVSIR